MMVRSLLLVSICASAVASAADQQDFTDLRLDGAVTQVAVEWDGEMDGAREPRSTPSRRVSAEVVTGELLDLDRGGWVIAGGIDIDHLDAVATADPTLIEPITTMDVHARYGLGYAIDHAVHIECTPELAVGRCNDHGGNRGYDYGFGLDLGAYWTSPQGFQLGLDVAYRAWWIRIRPLGGGSTMSMRALGFGGGLSVGWRL